MKIVFEKKKKKECAFNESNMYQHAALDKEFFFFKTWLKFFKN